MTILDSPRFFRTKKVTPCFTSKILLLMFRSNFMLKYKPSVPIDFNHDSNQLLTSLDIIHESNCINSPQQNGVAECKHRHLLQVSRAIKFQRSLPNSYWGLYNKSPSLEHLRVIGCLAYAIDPYSKDKFSPRAISCVLICYSLTRKGYKLLNIYPMRLFVSKDVSFHEKNISFS